MNKKEENAVKDFCLLSNGQNKEFDIEKRSKIQDFSVSTINKIRLENQFKNIHGIGQGKGNAKGLWIFPSFFNHSCIANVYNIGIGDFFIAHATEDIPKDKELTISYVNSVIPFIERLKMIKNDWNFICDCDLCKIEEKNLKINDERAFNKIYNLIYAGDYLNFNEEMKNFNVPFTRFLEDSDICKINKFKGYFYYAIMQRNFDKECLNFFECAYKYSENIDINF